MIKLFASDLDGTLLNALHRTDRCVLKAVAAVRDAGLHFSIATGRTMRSNRELGFEGNCLVVCANGAIVLDERCVPIRVSRLDPGFVEEVVRAFPQAPLEFVTPEHTYHLASEAEHRAALGQAPWWRRLTVRGRPNAGAPEHVYDCTLKTLDGLDVVKMNAHLQGSGLAEELHAFLAEWTGRVTNAPFDPCMFEVTSTGVDKGEALAWLAGYLGIGEDEVAVYGDGGNDVAMLGRFSRAYAPRGASEAARRAAGHVIGSNALHAVPRHMLRTIRSQRIY